MLVISRYNEDYSWVTKYTDDYIVYNKGERLSDPKVINVPNHGGNQIDIFRFAIDHWLQLFHYQTVVFIQARPFDHCTEEFFSRSIYNWYFTPLEFYTTPPANGYERRDFDGGYMELNNNWYIPSHNHTYGRSCKYNSLDEFMSKYFSNYHHVDWIRFSPGSQYVVPSGCLRHYPLRLWKALYDELPENNMTEAHIIERALWMILQCTLEVRNEYR